MEPSMRLLAALLALIPVLSLAGCPTAGDDDDAVSNCTADNRPTISIVSPETGEYYDSDETINWTLTVTDPDTPTDELTITLADNSDSQGIDLGVNVPAPGGNGQTSFSMAADLLDDGQAVVLVVVEDPDGCSANDSRLLCINEVIAPCTN